MTFTIFITLLAAVGLEIGQKWTAKNQKCLEARKAVYRQNAPKQQPKKLPKSEPYEGNSDIQQLVNTLSQALNQSMVVSSETEVRRNERALCVYSEGQSF